MTTDPSSMKRINRESLRTVKKNRENRRYGYNKPEMERQRRAKINHSLNILKDLVSPQNSDKEVKLEKSEILDLTLKKIHELQEKSQKVEHPCFREGFKECAKAIISFFEYQNMNPKDVNSCVDFLCYCWNESVNNNKLCDESPNIQINSRESEKTNASPMNGINIDQQFMENYAEMKIEASESIKPINLCTHNFTNEVGGIWRPWSYKYNH